MHHDTERHHPSSQTIHDAVADEDPSRWGLRRRGGASSSTYGSSPVASTTAPARRIASSPPVAEPPARRPVFSIGATFLGWAVAAFFTIVLGAVGAAFLGGAEVLDGSATLGALATAGFIGYLVASFLAYLVGGYAAGRISLWHGVWHGLGTVAWALIFGALGVLAGTFFAGELGIAPRLQLNGLTVAGIAALALSLLAMMAGAALGGRFGERYHEPSQRASSTRRAPRTGTRPL